MLFFCEIGETTYRLVAKHEAHKRIVWACSWNPFGNQFATGSRDKTVKVWAVEGGSSVKQLGILPPFRDSVTALAWLGIDRSRNAGTLAVGMDNGLLELWSVSGGQITGGDSELSPLSAVLATQLNPFLCHVSTVRRLAWREPESHGGNPSSMELASCGADQTVRVFKVF